MKWIKIALHFINARKLQQTFAGDTRAADHKTAV
jgi:hypothetical protein